MKCEAKQRFPSKISASLRSEIPAENRRIQSRRRRSVSRIQRRRESDGGGQDGDLGPKGGSPATPLLTWKIDGDGRGSKAKKKQQPESGSDDNGGGQRKRRGDRTAEIISVRRLAAGLWRLQPSEALASGRVKGLHRPVASEVFMGHLGISSLHDSNGSEFVSKSRDRQLQGPALIPHRMNSFCHKLESPVAFLNPALEQATKWDPRCTKTNNEVYSCYSQLRFLEDQNEPSSSIISVLQSELDLTRLRVYELEAEQRSSKKKKEHFLKKLREEKAAWRIREHENIRLVIDGVKEDLSRERKHRQRIEVMNSKLVNELADAKLTAKQLMQNYGKERKARELMEEVCDELAKEITEEKAELESLKTESMKIREDVEQERRMLQMAEVWREERLQMKLVDAKLALEEKYSQLNELQEELEAFLRSKTTLSPRELKEAGLLNEAVSSMNIQEIKEFSYHPPASEDGFSAYGDLHSGETNEKEIETCFGCEPDMACYSPASCSSKIHIVKPEIADLHESYLQLYTRSTNQNGSLGEDESVWDSGSQGDEQGFSNSLDRSDPSVHGHQQASKHSESGTEWEAHSNNIVNPETDLAYPASEQLRKKHSSVSRLWPSFPSKVDYFKNISAEVTKGRVSDVVASPDRASGHGVVTPGSVGHWSSPDVGNPHITRGRKGWIHWPRGFQKNSLKEKLFEARVECQKIQLRQALEQKI